MSNNNNIQLSEDGSFLVGESKTVNWFIAIVFILIDIGIIITESSNDHYGGRNYLLYIVLFMPALLAFRKMYDKKVSIKINGEGIYFYNDLITNWDGFENAVIQQKEYRGDELSDKFYITIIYTNIEEGIRYTYPLRVSASADKSEYEIIAAIQYFSGKQLSYDIYDL